ncbi:hypothetical protein FOZ61_005940 [Perkinsus olseni]|uniref:Amino acid transporter transmembrane domain-containing protein n=1 Tax=Perkinsus olseni TaxID=32597 RepID=A0A7J6MT70_PEROL|nr:hypothetical protein FOZ61_005940 [Perkinsus olseni]KAF4674410.1 hypothetical protein FOL46_004971 [Perkinsus olseni]
MTASPAACRAVDNADIIMFRNYAGYAETRLEDSWRADDEAEESLKDIIEEPLIGKPAAEQASSFVTSRHRTSGTSVGIAILKANLGSGILYLPRAWVNGGWLFSTLVLPVLAVMAATCSLRLVECRRVVRQGGYGDIMEKATGSRWGRFMIDLSLLALQSGICTGYFVFVANMASDISPWIASLSFSTKVAIQATVIAPLCWFRQVSKLSFTNFLANVLIFFSLCGLLGFIIAGGDEASSLHKDQRTYPRINFWDGGFLVFMGTALYVFEGIGLILPTYDSMREPEQFGKVFTRAFSITTASFLFIGLAGVALVAGRDLDHFISLIGSMCGLPLVFIAPPVCHMKLIGGNRKSDACILIFGLTVMKFLIEDLEDLEDL